VDDFFSTDPQSPLWETPSESNHDAFWLDICSRATGFVPDRDVYQCTSGLAVTPPSIRQIGRYKNIIWTYSSTYNAWRGVIEFTPESIIGTASNVPINYLPLFLARGGHLWTLGRSEKAGGLAAAFNERYMPLMPASFKDEMYPGPEDTSGVFCMPYKDYCVKSVDKVWGTFKTGDMPPGLIRSLDRDAMRFAYKDAADYITAQYPALPERLDLWEEVTKPGRFFDPMVRGFLYVEAYDPEYYMNYRLETSQPCFHPIYRMRSRNSLSVINNQTIAIWVTKYEDVVPEVQTGIAVPARSVHFGFPLWFFDRTAVDQIVDVVFDEWGILAAP
jgi:hypothetical protein